MTHAPESILGKSLTERHVVGKQPVDTKAVQSTVGDHPSRRNATPKRTATVLDILDEADEDTLVLFVLTGGASALLSASASTLTLNDLPATTDCLLDGGVPIDEINAGKHLSELKGDNSQGEPHLQLSSDSFWNDVIGNDLSTAGSGPSVPDETTYQEFYRCSNDLNSRHR
ncbi:DUF4147 domain-containing protein [Halocatena marina]|uniref:DUF4147 domain-containing protein n=1 Tax=Halocatena marina TaxID=2934937 RepID=UPI00361EBE11